MPNGVIGRYPYGVRVCRSRDMSMVWGTFAATLWNCSDQVSGLAR
jgi:hypothetical protein